MGVLSFEQKLIISLNDFLYRVESGDASGKSRDKAFTEIKEAADRYADQRVAEAYQSLLDSETGSTCICQLADTEVCDHNWSLCNVIRDRIAAIQSLTATEGDK